MSKDNNKRTISDENMKRLRARLVKVDKTLLHYAEMQMMRSPSEQLVSDIMNAQRSHLNKMVYEQAERHHVSIYDICLQFMPEMSEPKFITDNGTYKFEQDMRLVPIPFEPAEDPDHARCVAQIVREETIKEVCEWLYNHNDYICGSTNGIARYDIDELIKDLKKHFEE